MASGNQHGQQMLATFLKFLGAPRFREHHVEKILGAPRFREHHVENISRSFYTGKSRLVLILFDSRFKTLCQPTISHYMIDNIYIYFKSTFLWVIVIELSLLLFIIVIPYSLYILYLPKTNTSPTLPQVPHKYSARSTCSKTLSLVASPQKQIRGELAGTPEKNHSDLT